MTIQPITIVLAEDDDGHAMLIQRSLKRAGFVNEIVRVKDGQEALDFVHAQGTYTGRIHMNRLLILLDITEGCVK